MTNDDDNEVSAVRRRAAEHLTRELDVPIELLLNASNSLETSASVARTYENGWS